MEWYIQITRSTAQKYKCHAVDLYMYTINIIQAALLHNNKQNSAIFVKMDMQIYNINWCILLWGRSCWSSSTSPFYINMSVLSPWQNLWSTYAHLSQAGTLSRVQWAYNESREQYDKLSCLKSHLFAFLFWHKINTSSLIYSRLNENIRTNGWLECAIWPIIFHRTNSPIIINPLWILLEF